MKTPIKIDCNYWLLPLHSRNSGALHVLRDAATGAVLRHFQADLVEGVPQLHACYPVGDFRGRTLELECDDPARFLRLARPVDTPPPNDSAAAQAWRPRVHFSVRRGWMNDPNGLCFEHGRYHLFYQYNQMSLTWHNSMCWGHAVSTDLLHWHELDPALYPDENGSCFSGTAVVDTENHAGLNADILLFYTACGRVAPEPRPFTQCLAYSRDHGESFVRFAGNPAMGHVYGENRDPKVFFHAPTAHWVMLLYLGRIDGAHTYQFFHSDNLTDWREGEKIVTREASECPDFFEIVCVNAPEERYWVMMTAWGYYRIGHFDGYHFESLTPERSMLAWRHYGTAYAAQTFANTGERTVMLFWLNGDYPVQTGFNQSLGIPLDVGLTNSVDGLWLTTEPLRELASLRDGVFRYPEQTLDELSRLRGQAFDLEVEFSGRCLCSLWLRGLECVFDPGRGEVRFDGAAFPAAEAGRPCRLRLLIDQGSVEIFADGGRQYFAKRALFPPEFDYLASFGAAEGVTSMTVWRLKGIGSE